MANYDERILFDKRPSGERLDSLIASARADLQRVTPGNARWIFLIEDLAVLLELKELRGRVAVEGRE